MITLIAGIVALQEVSHGRSGGSTDPALEAARLDAMLDRMLDAMNRRGLPAERRTARAGPARLGAIAIASGRATAAPPPVLAEGGTLFASDAVLWDPASAGPGASDVERIAARIARDGPAASAGLHGDFAWARWDGSALVLARDHFGIRPMHYTIRPGQWIAFASDAEALLVAGLAAPRIDLPSVLNFTFINSPLPDRTYQAEIATLGPGRTVRITPDGHADTRRYWRLPMGPRLSVREDPAAVAGEIRRLMERAVRRRLPTSGPVGSHLSGGLDSSPLAVIAAREIAPAGRRLRAWSFEESPDDADFELIDEAPYVAELIAGEPNIDHSPISEPGFFGPLLGRYFPALLQPAGDDLPEHQVLAEAEAAGIGTILTGWGGDQIVSYYGAFPAAELFLHGHWGRMLQVLRSYNARLPVALYYQVMLALMPDRFRHAVERLTGRGYTPDKQRELFRPASAPQDRPSLRRPPRGMTFRSRREMVERVFIQHRLQHFSLLGAPYGVRYVFPLLDLDLVAFAMRVPNTFLLRDRVPRRLMRDAIRGLVPERMRLREEKLFPHSLDTLRLPRLRDRFVARLDRIPPDGLAARAVDIPALRRALIDRVEGEEETRAKMREHAARGEQLYIEGFDLIHPLQLALALDDYEGRFGAEAFPGGSGASDDPSKAP